MMVRTVSIHTTGLEAHVVRCRLEYEGIPAFVAFEHHVWANWSLSVALGGVKVQVPEIFFDDAVEIVFNIRSGNYAAELEAEEYEQEQTQCPSCGSEKVVDINWSWKVSLVAFLLLVLPLPYTRHSKKCGDCSNRWIASDQRGCSLNIIAIVLLAYGVLLLILMEIWCQWCRLHCALSYLCVS